MRIKKSRCCMVANMLAAKIVPLMTSTAPPPVNVFVEILNAPVAGKIQVICACTECSKTNHLEYCRFNEIHP